MENFLDLSNSGLTGILDLSKYNNSVYTNIDCSHNACTQIIGIPSQIEVLNCGHNLINNLNIFNLPKLKYLFCEENQIKKLCIGNCEKLEYLECSYNLLDQIDCKLLGQIYSNSGYVNCSYNQIDRICRSVPINFSWIDCSNQSTQSALNCSNHSF